MKEDFNKISKQISDRVWDQIRLQTQNQVNHQVRLEMSVQIDDQAYWQVCGLIEEEYDENLNPINAS